jgi:cysteine-rich repeat protein
VTPSAAGPTPFDCAGPKGYALTFHFAMPARETRVLTYLASPRKHQAALARAISALEGAPAGIVLAGIAAAEPPRIVNWALRPAAVCGNGTLQAGEAWDDGNTMAGDCCSATRTTESCGHGLPCLGRGVRRRRDLHRGVGRPSGRRPRGRGEHLPRGGGAL